MHTRGLKVPSPPLSFCSTEIYTIQGNSHGRPCYLPFLYDGQWFHSCTSIGREDGHLWCATSFDYGKDERWGFCPVKSESAGLQRNFRLLIFRPPDRPPSFFPPSPSQAAAARRSGTLTR